MAGESNGFDVGVALATAIPGIIAAVLAYVASLAARAAHREVKSPNGTPTGVQAYEMAKRQQHMQVVQAEVQELAQAVARDLESMRARQEEVALELEAHTMQDAKNFAELHHQLNDVLRNQTAP